MPVADGNDFLDVLFYAVDDAVVAEKNLANILTSKLPDYAAGKREALKVGNSIEYGIFPFPRRRPVSALPRDVLNALLAAKFAALGPANHRPSFLLIRSRSACASRISSSWVVNSPRSSSASAVQRSSMSSSVSRMLSKSATSMMTFEATPFCVMRSGRRVLVLRLKHSAIVLRKVEKVTTSSARRIVFIVRSRTGMENLFCGLRERRYCTTCCTLVSRGGHAAFRRVAGGALSVRMERGGRRLAGDGSPHCGVLQRFERVGIEEKVNKTDVGDAAVVVGSGLERVVGYHHLFEGIAGVAKREGLLFPLLGGGDGVCGLDIYLPRTAIDDEIDFVLSYRVLPGGVVVALHNADVNGISTPDEFVVDGVFHEVREFRLAEVDARVPEAGIGGVVFHRVVEVAAPLDVKALCLADKKGVGKVVKVLDDGVSARIDSGNGFCGVGEFGRVCERGGVAHHDVDYLLKEQIVPDVVSFHDVAEINGCVKIFKVRLFCRRRLGEDAIGEPPVEKIFLDYLEGVPFRSSEGHELGKGQRCNLYHMPSASELRCDIGGEQPGIGACHINIDILGGSQTVQNTIEVHKHPLAVVRVDSGKVNPFRKSLAAVLNLVNEHIVHLPVVSKLGANVAVKFDWIDKIGGYGMFKVDFNDVVGRHSVFQKMGLEYVEQKIAFATTPYAGKNLDEAVVLSLDDAIQEVIPLDRHFRCSVYMFVVFHKDVSSIS